MVPSNSLILLKRFISSLFILMLSHVGLAQITPVQVTPQLLPPYSLQVSDYYSGVQPKLQVMLLNRDINQPVIRVRLRMTVESQNCRMRTRPNAVTPVFTLTNGVPFYLTPQDLQAFFLASNLEIGGGYSEQQYVQTGRLPEGLYSIYFEAFEEVTGNLVSNKGFSLGWLTLAEPPILNTPARNEDVKPGTPQNIVFNWTPRHNTSVTAGYYTDYVFTIVEYMDTYMSPDAAFTANPPLFMDSVQNTTYLMGAAHPQLIPGRRYAWRVQAKSKDGSNQPVMFRNNGFSEVFVFNYRNNCNAPLGIISSINGQRASVEWQNDPMHLEWRVEYREKNNPKAEWFSLSNTLPRVLITDLKPGTQYEYRVGGACIASNFVYSPLGSFTTAGFNQNYMPGCGDTILPAPGSGNPRQTLVAGDSIQAGSFTVYVGYVTGTGSFSGQGYVIVPWLANAKVEVQFSNITVSEDKKLLTGEITTTYDPTESGIDDIDEYIDIFKAGMGVGDVITGLNQADTTFNFEIAGPGSINVVLPPSYNPQTGKGTEPISITVQPVPSSGPGGSTPAPANYTVDSLPTTLKDAKDNVFKVNQNGQVVQIASGDGKSLLESANRKKIDSDKGVVHFIDYPEKQKYAFDGWKEVYKKSSTFSKEYERLENYYVSQKAIAPSETDFIKAQVELKDSSINPRNIEFVSGTGVKYVKKALDSTYTLYEIEVIGGPGKDAQEIYALYKPAGSKTLNLGKIKVSSYPRVERKVYLVPINGFALNIDTVKKVLNGFFNKVNVHFSVIQESTYSNFEWDLNSDGRLDISSDKLFNVLSKEMILLNKFYRKDNDLDPNGIYIFLVRSQGDSKHENLVLGEMPKGKQFGYIFTNDEYSVDKDLKFSKVISHEVGHGAFALRHLFEYGELTEGESDLNNLMDYPLGANLLKAQWDFIHDPALSFGFLQDDLDIAYLDTLSDNGVLNIVTNGSTNFLSPSGELLTLPDKTVIYFYCLNYNILNGNGDGVPNGSVYGFKLPNGKEYTASINYETNIFNGYFEVINKGRVRDWKYNGSGASRQKIKYINTTTQDQGEKLISFLHLTRNGCNQSHSVWFLEQNFNFIPKPNNDFSLFYPNYLTNVEPVQDRVFDVGLKGCKDCTLKDVKAPKVLGGAKRRIDEQFFSYKEFLGSNETINMSPEDKLTLQEFFRALGSEFKLKFEVFIYPKNGTQSGLANDEYTTVRNQTGKKAIKIEVLEDGKLQIGDYQGVAERAVFDFDLWGFGIGNDCAAQYVQDKLAGTINENSVWLFCKKLYYGIKGVLVCKLGESNALLYDKTTQFVYGFAYEFIETIDVPEILNGLKDLGVAFAKFSLVEAPKMYIGLLKDIGSYAFQITLGGRNASIKDFLSFVIPQQFYAGFNSAKNAAKGLYSYFIENGNSWRYGQLTYPTEQLMVGVVASNFEAAGFRCRWL